MADKSKIVPGNAPGDFFVDTSCISCGNCRDLAPEIFAKVGIYYAVVKQPEGTNELKETLDALVCCPEGSIGGHEKHDLRAAVDSFPEHLGDGVFYLGFNSPASAGGKSYFIVSDHGNWMIDSPKFTPRLVKWIEERGGIKYIFLTHRDDVAEAHQYASKFGAKRLIHRAELESQPEAEIVIDGTDERAFDQDFIVIPQPGHTEGHCMLLFKNYYLFSGDVFTSRQRFNEGLEVWEPFYCWWSWQELTNSLVKLKRYCFQLVLPAHGRRFSTGASEMKLCLEAAIARCQEEQEPDPATPARIKMFERIAEGFAEAGQQSNARQMEEHAAELQKRMQQSSGA
jgi:glyoxylase-like metal-dependent hydrolase (beta-lactamase superfamily II)/ferredoxin